MTERESNPSELPGDPSGIDEPHDILAADQFGIGTRDERLPPDPTGIHEPHDVLAAEEFAMPAGAEPHEEGGGPDPRTLIPLALVLAALVALALARRRG
jgi:MYXO-CTERM domain-containing protein